MAAPDRIRTVFFDLGGTLIDVPSFPACLDTLAALRIEVDADALVHAFRELDAALDRPGGPDIDQAEFWRRVIEASAGRAVSRATVEEFLREYDAREVPHPAFSDVRRCLDELHGTKRRLGVISNARSEERLLALLSEAGLDGYFDWTIASGTEGVRKPDPEIFRRAVERAGVRPAEAVHVGDLLYTDAKGATAAGLRGVWLNRNGTGFSDDPPEITSLLELPRFILQVEGRSR